MNDSYALIVRASIYQARGQEFSNGGARLLKKCLTWRICFLALHPSPGTFSSMRCTSTLCPYSLYACVRTRDIQKQIFLSQ